MTQNTYDKMYVAKVDYKGRMNRQKKKVNEKAEG